MRHVSIGAFKKLVVDRLILPVRNVFPPVIQIVTHTAEISAGRFCVVAEIDQSLKDLRATIAFFLVTDE